MAAGELRDGILSCTIRPGTLLGAAQLAAQFGISRTPVHEALKRLCGEGLVSVVPRVGYVVAPLRLTAIQEAFQLRLVLEPFAAELALQVATEIELREFHRSWFPDGKPRRAGITADDPRFAQRVIEIHDQFHLELAALSGNQLLVEMITQLLHTTRRALMPHAVRLLHETRAAGVSSHLLVAEAMAARDVEGAVSYTVDHVRRAEAEVLASLAQSSGSGETARRARRWHLRARPRTGD